MNPIFQAIKKRRSTYPAQFKKGIIPEHHIETLLEAARWAPTHKMTEPWRFVVFGPEYITTFIDNLVAAYKKKFSEEERSPKRLEKLEKRKNQVSHVIAIVMHRDSEERLPEIEEIAAVSCAAQNIYLMMDSLDIVGYWGSGFAYSEHMRQFLELSDQEQCMGYFFLGLKDEDLPVPPATRRPLSEVVRRFGD